jgi:hypothetical protein
MASKRSEKTNIKVRIKDVEFFNTYAAETFVQVIENISDIVGEEKFVDENSNSNFLSKTKDSFPVYSQSAIKLSKTGKFFINPYSSTEEKRKNITELFNRYNIDGDIEVTGRLINYTEFWNTLIPKLSQVTEIFKPTRRSSQPWLSGSTGIRSFHINCSVNTKRCEVMLWINRGTKEENKKIFDFLFSKKEEIENSFGDTLKFSRLSDNKVSAISYEMKKNEKSSEEDIHDFFVTYYPKFEKTFNVYFDDIRKLINDETVCDEEIVSDEEIGCEDELNDISSVEVKRVVNPFGAKEETAAICVTGDSGAGKSYRVEKTLTSNEHRFIFEILDPTSTGLLTQYQSGSYVRNNVGDFIIDAQNDPGNFYTIVLDECHKDGFIDRINAELLQCLSSKRNDGLRYFQTNKVTDNLFSDLGKQNGRRIVPHNVGFILITSKPDIIHGNDDIKNRVDVIHFQLEDRDKDFTIENLTKKEVKVKEDKYENQD